MRHVFICTLLWSLTIPAAQTTPSRPQPPQATAPVLSTSAASVRSWTSRLHVPAIRRSGRWPRPHLVEGARRSLPLLQHFLNDLNEDLHQVTFEIIRRIGPAAIPMLTELLRDGRASIRGSAADAFIDLAPYTESVQPALRRALNDEDSVVAGDAARAAGCVGREGQPFSRRARQDSVARGPVRPPLRGGGARVHRPVRPRRPPRLPDRLDDPVAGRPMGGVRGPGEHRPAARTPGPAACARHWPTTRCSFASPPPCAREHRSPPGAGRRAAEGCGRPGQCAPSRVVAPPGSPAPPPPPAARAPTAAAAQPIRSRDAPAAARHRPRRGRPAARLGHRHRPQCRVERRAGRRHVRPAGRRRRRRLRRHRQRPRPQPRVQRRRAACSWRFAPPTARSSGRTSPRASSAACGSSSSPPRPAPRYVDGDRLYYLTAECQLRCLDTDGFRDGDNDGPTSRAVPRRPAPPTSSGSWTCAPARRLPARGVQQRGAARRRPAGRLHLQRPKRGPHPRPLAAGAEPDRGGPRTGRGRLARDRPRRARAARPVEQPRRRPTSTAARRCCSAAATAGSAATTPPPAARSGGSTATRKTPAGSRARRLLPQPDRRLARVRRPTAASSSPWATTRPTATARRCCTRSAPTATAT